MLFDSFWLIEILVLYYGNGFAKDESQGKGTVFEMEEWKIMKGARKKILRIEKRIIYID